MKRRTLQRVRPESQPEHHHNVYVVLLDPAAGRIRSVRTANPNRNPKKPCVYVGMTGLTPEERFANHKHGIKSASVVKRYGLRLLPELYEHLNSMPFEAAARMEVDLAEDLRRAGLHGHGRALAGHEQPRQRQKGFWATRPDTGIRNVNCARRIVNKMLDCRPGSEYGLDSFKEKRSLKNM